MATEKCIFKNQENNQREEEHFEINNFDWSLIKLILFLELLLQMENHLLSLIKNNKQKNLYAFTIKFNIYNTKSTTVPVMHKESLGKTVPHIKKGWISVP